MDSGTEASLAETAQAALKQLDEQQYEAALLCRGISKGKIRKYGFAFK